MTENADEEGPREKRGREAIRDGDLDSVLGHAYRGELDRETTWRSRLDQTTTWSVTVMAAILTWAFSSADNPHYVVLVGVLAVGLFLLIEARRYRDYDVYRARVRLFQQHFLADALDPPGDARTDRVAEFGDDHRSELEDDWRTELGDDYRRPTLKVTVFEAVANRLRRIYFPLLSVLGLAWLFRVTAFAGDATLLEAASVGAVPGIAVFAALAAFYAGLAAIVLWPREREAKGEFREVEPGEWKGGE